MNELSIEVKAQEIHERAVGFYKISEQYGYKFLMEVKTIRDEKLYKELGFETFEDYTLQAFNYSRETISKRIKSAEVFGEENVEALRHLGTQKINELATMPEEQRNHVIENGIETKNGNKSIDEATTRELEKYKKQLKQRDEEKLQLESQLTQVQRSESIARKQLEEAEDRDPEVIEKYMEPEDYQSIKNMNEHLQSEREYYKKQADGFRDEVKNIMQQTNKPTENNRGDNKEDYTPTLLQLLKPAKEFINYYSHHISKEKALNEIEKIKNILKEQ